MPLLAVDTIVILLIGEEFSSCCVVVYEAVVRIDLLVCFAIVRVPANGAHNMDIHRLIRDEECELNILFTLVSQLSTNLTASMKRFELIGHTLHKRSQIQNWVHTNACEKLI